MDSECLKLNDNHLLKIVFEAATATKRNCSKVLSNSSKFAIKKNGGEIAIIEDSLTANISVKIFTSAGQVASMGWSQKDELLEIVFVDGYLRVFTEDFVNYKEFQILPKESEEKIIETQFLKDSSFICLTSDNRFIKLDLFDLKLFDYAIPECLEFNSPQCWTISRDESILFAQSSYIYHLSTNDELTQKKIPYKTVCHMSANDVSNELLILTLDCRLIVLDIKNNFQPRYDISIEHEIDIFSVNGIQWLNSSIAAILQSASGKLHLVDLYSGKNVQLLFPKNFITAKEVDGIRIIDRNSNSIITKMPAILVELNYRSSDQSLISEFYERFIKNEFEEIKRFSVAKLVEIIDTCAKSLPQLAYQKSLQNNLQKALKFANQVLKEHLDDDENSRQTFTYISAMIQSSFAKCSALDKILSQGISITPLEFDDSKIVERILAQLYRRNLDYLAFELAVLLGIDLTAIIMNWARKGIMKSEKIIDDETLWYQISDKIFTWCHQPATHIDFFELAELALANKRLKLTRKLISFESDNRKKIELLAALPDHRIAIIESVKTGNQDQMNSSIPYSRSKCSSIEELKALTSGKSGPSNSPALSSSTRVFTPLSNLNVPRDLADKRLEFFKGAPLGRSVNVPLSELASTSTIPPTTSQVNLRTTAQIINGWIQKDKISLDLEELLSGQFSREYIYGDEHRPILKFNRLSVIPEILLNQVRQLGNAEGKCLMGVFPEINRAWLVAGNALYLWSFENNRDFTCFLKSPYDIIDVALIRVKSGVFVETIEWALVVVTAVEIFLLAVSFEAFDQSNSLTSIQLNSHSKAQKNIKNYSALDLVLHETDIRFPTDEIYMVSVCGTHDGRIFLAGNDGNIYELLYKSDSDWFTSKSKKVNRTASSLSFIIPTFLRSSVDRVRIVKLVHDSTRNLLYGLSEESTIRMYWLGQTGADFEFIGTTGDLSIEATKLTPAGIITSPNSLSIISIHPVFGTESDRVNLLAICRSGIRLYFSSIFQSSSNLTLNSTRNFQNQQQSTQLSHAPRCLRLVHIRAPPEENRIRDPKKMVHRWSPNIHNAFYSNGVTLAANSITCEEDLILGMIINPSIGSNSSSQRLPMEYSVETPIEGKVWAIEEMNRNEIFKSEQKWLQSEFSISHNLCRRSFVILTNFGAYIFSKLRPIDQLYLLLSERSLPWDRLERFFDAYGMDRSCAFCIALCCGLISDINNSNNFDGFDFSYNVSNNAISVLLKSGGKPRLLDSINQQHNSILPQSIMRESIGRIIAIQPEFENSAMHEGFFIVFSRLTSKIWKKCLWDIQSIPDNLFVDLNRFHKFISENLSHFTENRIGSSGQSDFSEDLARRQKIALEYENDSLLQLKDIAKLLIELLSFVSICIDYNLLEFLRSEPISRENSGIDVESLLTSFKGKSLITDIGNILVQRQLRLRAPVRSLCENLRARCPYFFSEDDVILQEAIEALERARVCKNEVERAELVSESLEYLLKACKAIPISNLFLIFDQLDLLGYPDASIRLGIRYIEIMDPENISFLRENNPEIQLDSDQHEICRQRENIYDRLMQSIGCTGFVQEYTNTLLSNCPGIAVDSLRVKCINLIAASQDKLLHFRFYDWLIRQQFSSTILELPYSEHLQDYLKTTFLTRSDAHRDLLWKWLAKARRYSEAASVLSTIAESREYALSLSERIEYLSLAVALLKSNPLENIEDAPAYMHIFLNSSNCSPIELHEIEERLEVAHIQMELLQDAMTSRGNRNDPICVELDGAVGLLSVTEMFNRYSRPYGLSETCLRLIHVSGLVNERLVAQLWQDIISKYLAKTADRASFQVLGSKISELARKLYPSPGAFPFAHLIDVLGRLCISTNIQPDWLIVLFIEGGIPFTAISDEFHRFFVSPPSKAWLSPSFRIYLLEMLAILYVLYNNDPSQKLLNNSSIVTRIKSYAIVADELHASELVNEFGIILRKLATL